MNKRILVVDDEKNIRLTIKRCLEPDRYTVYEAASGEESLDRLMLVPYDLVLLDLRLPGISGTDMMARLSELGVGAKIVVITAHGTIELAENTLKSGALDFVEKPFSPGEIRQIVAKYA
ncbi:MAG: response regulator [Candidatus Cloacimonadaceae bacterium]|nr:response regulator [Candidatus Cloacimonadaceae bacterium]